MSQAKAIDEQLGSFIVLHSSLFHDSTAAKL
jgi:hypothetical protein